MRGILVLLVSVLWLSVVSLGVTTLAHAISPVVIQAVADRPVTLKLESGGKIDGDILSRGDATFIIVDTDGDVYEIAYEDVQTVSVRTAATFEEQGVAGGSGEAPAVARPVGGVRDTWPLAGRWIAKYQHAAPWMRVMYVNSESDEGLLTVSRHCGTLQEGLTVSWASGLPGRFTVLASYGDAEPGPVLTEGRQRTLTRVSNAERVMEELKHVALFRVTVQNSMVTRNYVFPMDGLEEALQELRRSCADR